MHSDRPTAVEVGAASIGFLTEQCVCSLAQLMFCACSFSVPPGSLESIPRQELEQRLRSSMIMVEALVQQLSAARAQGAPATAAPSSLREKLVQTDHTELSQVRSQKGAQYLPFFFKWRTYTIEFYESEAIYHMDDISRHSLIIGLCLSEFTQVSCCNFLFLSIVATLHYIC